MKTNLYRHPKPTQSFGSSLVNFNEDFTLNHADVFQKTRPKDEELDFHHKAMQGNKLNLSVIMPEQPRKTSYNESGPGY